MDPIAEIFFHYLRDVIYAPANARLEVEKLPEGFKDLGSGLAFFSQCVMEANQLARALSQGDLNAKLPARDNEIAAPLKSLHASLKHLTWQSQQIARGDYTQRVDFMGEFSNAFNTMTQQLAERQKNLECKIAEMQQKTTSLEQSNFLLSTLMQYVSLQIIVIAKATGEVLFTNGPASKEIERDPAYMRSLLSITGRPGACDQGVQGFDFSYRQGEHKRYFAGKAYPIEWGSASAQVFVVSDESASKSHIEALKADAYYDSLTGLYNRTFGMLTLGSWLREQARFALVFTDLDNLKYINDEFGHSEGDVYIKKAAGYLKGFSADCVACRIGGDEFMVLVPNAGYSEVHAAMHRLSRDFEKNECPAESPCFYSISFGIAAVDEESTLPASDILSLADERMYRHKREKKRARQKKACG